MHIFLLASSVLVGVVLAGGMHRHAEDCEDCRAEAEEVLRKGRVLPSGAGDGEKLPAADAVQDTDRALRKARDEEEKARMAAAEKGAELARIEKYVAEQRVRQLTRKRELLSARAREIENTGHGKPEAVAKQPAPVVVFPQEGIPLYHHTRMLLSNIQNVRHGSLEQIRAGPKAELLDGVTGDLAEHDRLHPLEDADSGSCYPPVSRAEGMFFASPQRRSPGARLPPKSPRSRTASGDSPSGRAGRPAARLDGRNALSCV